MAKRKKSKRLSFAQKFMIVGASLIVGEGVILFYFQSQEDISAPEVRDSIASKVEGAKDLNQSEKAMLQVRLALSDYQLNNTGKLPESLNELVPTYFERVPVDPSTGKPFEYKKDGTSFVIGSNVTLAKNSSAKKGKNGLVVVPSDPEELKKAEDQILVAEIGEGGVQTVAYLYDPTGKRDPFEPFNLAPEIDNEDLSPLERYDISALKVTAILDGLENPKAIIENSQGKGFTVEKGTKIGTNQGVVVEIQRDKILILETSVDFTGKTQAITIEMKLRAGEEAL